MRTFFKSLLFHPNKSVRIAFFIFCILFFLFGFFKNLSADTLILRNGIEYKNVRTTLGKSNVTLESESGEKLNIPISSIKSIKSLPVQWTNTSRNSLKPEDENTTDNDVFQDSSKKRTNQSQSFHNNVEIARQSIREALPSLIPGWSNLYLLGYPSLGAFFSMSELYLVHLISLYTKPTVHFYDDPVHLLSAYANLDPSVSPQNPKFISLVISYENASLVKDPISGGYTTSEKIKEGKERAITGLLSVLILDFSVTQVISMISKKKERTSMEKGSFELKVGSRFRPEAGESESKVSLVFYF
ncbi:hypothetical protein [Leptospira stimsonii]|uniref:Uncharacterized protein n=1 Tax=Leptospira stimsonii TaxID=2202203 RepID=A0A396ZDS1_9LEPT|nr:hypothetical protein [Leptospira stimsonii]RHX92044.1 hypothetical protein DLM75_02125 [Leptospira stimsonii]